MDGQKARREKARERVICNVGKWMTYVNRKNLLDFKRWRTFVCLNLAIKEDERQSYLYNKMRRREYPIAKQQQ